MFTQTNQQLTTSKWGISAKPKMEMNGQENARRVAPAPENPCRSCNACHKSTKGPKLRNPMEEKFFDKEINAQASNRYNHLTNWRSEYTQASAYQNRNK